MLRAMFVSSITMLLPLAAGAQSVSRYQCTLGDLTRRVEIVQATSAPVPCEVQYFKDSEASGGPEVLWSANNEAGYCEARAAEFVARLGTLGWACNESEPAARATDDTDVLSPQQPAPQ